jgi:hypothetical protein
MAAVEVSEADAAQPGAGRAEPPGQPLLRRQQRLPRPAVAAAAAGPAGLRPKDTMSLRRLGRLRPCKR